MIVVYPLICSGTLSESTLPAISKTLERYLIVYYTNELFRDVNQNAHKIGAKNYKIKPGGKVFLEDIEMEGVWPTTAGRTKPQSSGRSSEEIEADIRDAEARLSSTERDRERYSTNPVDPTIYPAHPMGPQLPQRVPQTGQQSAQDAQSYEDMLAKRRGEERDEEKLRLLHLKDKRDVEKDISQKIKDSKGKIEANISQPAVELAPTTVIVNTPNGPGFVGVKVIPIRVKSEMDFTYYLEKDNDLNFVMGLAVAIGRRSGRFVYKWYDKTLGKIFSSQSPKGDARHDVIYARSGFSIRGLVLVDRNQMSENFMKGATQVGRMQKLGWDNIILADDINRYAYFCMTKFRGICASIPYQMMYRTLGQDQVYDSIEQARAKNVSLFKTGPKMSKLLGENIAERKTGRYICNENQTLLDEIELPDLMNKFSPVKLKSIMNDIQEKVKDEDIKGAYKIVRTLGFNENHTNLIFEKGKEKDPQLEEAKEIAFKVMKNSLPPKTMKNKKLVNVVTNYLAFSASLLKKKYGNSTKKAVKEILQDYIPKVRTFYEEQQQELEGESKRPRAAIYHTIEAAIGIVVITTFLFIGPAIILYAWLNAMMFLGIIASVAACIIIYHTLKEILKDTVATDINN